MKHVRIGIVGAGQISESCCKGVADHTHGEVVAVADMNSDRLDALCEAYSTGKRYKSHDELFADPEVDAVYIAVPNFLHAPMATQALESGKHIILDKPFVLSLNEAESVATAATVNNKRLFMLGMNQINAMN